MNDIIYNQSGQTNQIIHVYQKKNQNIYVKILMSRSMHVGYIRHAQTRQEEEQGTRTGGLKPKT